MTTHYLSDAISLASIKAQKEGRRYAVDRTYTFGKYAVRPALPDESLDKLATEAFVEADGTIVKKSQPDSK